MRIRKPHHFPKAHFRFTPHVTVRQRIGPTSFSLSDGKTWNATNLAHCPSVAGQNCDTSQLPRAHVNHYPSNQQPRGLVQAYVEQGLSYAIICTLFIAEY